jgi:hypothetical protein
MDVDQLGQQVQALREMGMKNELDEMIDELTTVATIWFFSSVIAAVCIGVIAWCLL